VIRKLSSEPPGNRRAVVTGLFFIGCGVLPILMATGVITPTDTAPVPRWVPICAGLTFIAAGLTIVVDYGVARIGPDGQLAPETPLLIQAASLLLALTIVGLMAAIAGWVAFGSGPRSFTSTVSLPFYTSTRRGGELGGRIAFGISTVLLVLAFAASGAVGLRRLWHVWHAQAARR
jgi:hypothetical protein